jgi:GTP-binding protein
MGERVPVIAIIGRTNVGKSTLFNALAGRRIAVVEDTPGVTRDRNYHLTRKFGVPLTVVDTGGLVGEEETTLQDAVRIQAELAIAEADLILAVLDGKYGPHPLDGNVVERLRRSGKPVLWVINKTEKEAWALQAGEFYSLGLDELQLVSAANNIGIKELAKTIIARLGLNTEALVEEETETDKPIRVAIVGRPNVGKSTLINKLLGEERLVASNLPGTTRDTVDVEIAREGQRFTLVDTAGLRRRSKVEDESVERFANLRSLNALAECDVAVLVIDAEEGVPTDQDIRIGTLIHERGRAFVIAVNKWDAVEKDDKTAKHYEEMVYASFNFARYAPVIFISAKTGKRCPTLFDKVKEVYEGSRQMVEQEQFEEALTNAVRANLPPVYHGRPIKFMSGEQISSNPPTFEVVVNYPRALTDTYIRYLKGKLRETFPFPGSDIRLFFRKKTRKAEQNEARETGIEPIIQEWDL